MQLQYLVLTAAEYWQITAALSFAALAYWLYRKLAKQYNPKQDEPTRPIHHEILDEIHNN